MQLIPKTRSICQETRDTEGATLGLKADYNKINSEVFTEFTRRWKNRKELSLCLCKSTHCSAAALHHFQERVENV
jgi:hypothetical protein